MYAFDSWIFPMVKALIDYGIIKVLLQHILLFYVEGPNCFALTQLMNVIDFQFTTVDLCHRMGY